MTRRFAGEDNFHQAVRDAFQLLETTVALTVESKTQSAPNGSESAGEVYIVPSGATGAWAGEDDNLAILKASWEFIDVSLPPIVQAYHAFVKDEGVFYVYNPSSGNWEATTSGGGGGAAISADQLLTQAQQSDPDQFDLLVDENGDVLIQA